MRDYDKNLQEIVLTELEKRIGNTAIILGYFEHQVDILTQVVKDLASLVDVSKLPEDAKERIEALNTLLEYSSVDFDNIDSPFENYKVPKAVEMKKVIRTIQEQYLTAKMREGKL